MKQIIVLHMKLFRPCFMELFTYTIYGLVESYSRTKDTKYGLKS